MNTVNLLLLAIEAALASLILPLLAALLSRAYPRSAGRRRLVWVTLFAILLALPLVTILSPTLAVITLPAPSHIPADANAYVPAPASAPLPEAAAPPASVFTGATGAILLALCAWALGALWIGVRSLAGLAWLLRLRIRSASLPPERLPLPLPRRCSVRLSPDCPGPMTWGAAWPVILLPDDALDWPAERLEAALRHELAHVVCRDSLIQALALLACALYWPNPLVWRAAGALRREAESAADDAVIAAGVRPSDYASLLVDLAGDWSSRHPPAFEMAMAAPPILTERVQSILSPNALRSGATPMDSLKFALVGGAALAALALARPSIAEVAPPAAPAQHVDLTPAAPQHLDLRALADAKPQAAAQGVAPARPAKPATAPSNEANLQIAEQDVPSPPAVAAPTPPALPPLPAPTGGAPAGWTVGFIANPNGPSAPPAAPAAPAPGATSATPFTLQWIPNPNPGGPRSQQRVIIGGRMTPEQRAELDRKTAAIGPAIDKAIKDAHIEETVRKALSAQDANTREEVARQLKEIGPIIQRQIAGVEIQERFAQLQPQFEEARRKAEERQAQAEDRVADQLEEQAKRARERAQRAREQLKQLPSTPQPAPTPKN